MVGRQSSLRTVFLVLRMSAVLLLDLARHQDIEGDLGFFAKALARTFVRYSPRNLTPLSSY
jgi:hypothetical protein